MRRWLPAFVVGVMWAAPTSATAGAPELAECTFALPGTVQIGATGQSIAYVGDVFCVPNGDKVSNPVIEWGDGTTGPGTIMVDESGRLVVKDTHAYTNPGAFLIRATVTDDASGRSYSAGSEVEADIRPAPAPAIPASSGPLTPAADPPVSSVSVIGYNVTARRDSRLRCVVAVVHGGMPSSSLRAIISWGDGTENRGTVTGIGTLHVSGRHQWRRSGHYALVVTLTNASGHLVARATSRAAVVSGK
jgi:hypothetical protein